MRNARMTIWLVVVVCVLAVSPVSFAVLVRVDWSASIPELTPPNPGPGELSGSLGVFDVVSAGDTFLLSSDGSLTALASGFDEAEFRNGIYSFTRTFPQGAPELQFLSVGDSPDEFAVNFVDINTGLLSNMEAWTIGGIDGAIAVELFDQASSGIDRAGAIFSTSGATKPTSPVAYSFTIVPEPTTLLLLGLGGVMLGRKR